MVCDDLGRKVLVVLEVAWGFWVIGLWSIVIGQLPSGKIKEPKNRRTESEADASHMSIEKRREKRAIKMADFAKLRETASEGERG